MDPTRQAIAFEASATGFLLILALFFFAPNRPAQSDAPKQSSEPSAHLSAQELVKKMVQNEVKADADDTTHWRFRKVDVKPSESETWDVVETKNGEVQRLIAIDGRPLTKAQREAEQARIRKFVDSSKEQAEKRKASSSDFKKEQDLMEMLPNALLYQYAGKRDGLIRLTFKPNPRFHASTREAEVFHHMTGELLISKGSTRLAELRGQLASRVNFGYGLLGHLDKGGTFDVKQQDVGDGHWDSILLDTNLTGKALFFKNITVREKVTEFDYHRVSDDLTVQQAAELLKRDSSQSASTPSAARKTS
ncbi:MAG: hypothetical protein WBE86_02350 [Candidatus Acidiferrales bacterium]